MKKLLSLLLSLMVLFVSCNPDDENNQDPKPVMPPEYSMAPDFDDFQTDGNQRNQTIENWFYSAVNVGVYSAILKGSLAIPVTAFKVTISQEPFFDTDAGVWTWESSFSAHSNDYTIRLTADVADGNVDWKGYITSTGTPSTSSFTPPENFLWFEGQSTVDGNSGSWTLIESPANPSPWISTQWSRNEAQTEANALFTIEKEGELLGSYIDYSRDEDSDYNRSVEISNTQSNDLIQIEWNSELKFGRVKSTNHFGDSNFHCWNEDLQDVTCEE
ncbi:hypothetical protein MATR_10450 [Marivirga tractuosa]|uniref:Lipoprotein n=1 Tax=Marivirga tractuosa (strain ATCC 23168 / DSM 4126 / NBRC 15989 / NCIMB 1408 / VKM B-1430 / H-43) TaxID=643867 RepID=E4TM50_MARTH|nr:hypothetical protein [Marivirga tractuosa]ADR21326.1 hypothetical protein Ftrac_1336 [Marivirga tractuosa DSM 4126]BDD14220.1 hypothetical protein MATR_10450 [Marivirga tractuosa]